MALERPATDFARVADRRAKQLDEEAPVISAVESASEEK
jgi:DNA-directed RNA polymerase subunit K/omega